MFEQIISGLVYREKYYIKKNGDIVGDLLFDSYNQSKTALWFVMLDERYAYLFQLNEIIIYRYVTHKEYFKKIKEKYDAKCLDIVLKRLVDETFKWL
jgi:hypothetical protein